MLRGIVTAFFVNIAALFVLYTSSRLYMIPKNTIRSTTDSIEHQQGSHYRSTHLIVERYGGQQGAGIIGIASLQCWAGSLGLNISIVEPCIRDTVIVGLLNMSLEKNSTMVLGDYFNIEHINGMSHRLGMSGIITLNEALSKPLKKIVFVQTMTKDIKVLWSGDPENPCYNESKHHVTHIRLKTRGYCIVRIVAAEWSNFMKGNLRFIMGPYYKQNITLVVSRWEALRFVEEKSRFSSCTEERVKHWFTPSKMLLNHAKHYENTYLASKNTLAIMIRLEHIFMAFSRLKNTPSHCFKEVTNIIKRHRLYKYHPMIAADVGQHGSNTFNRFAKDSQYLNLHNATTLLKEMIPVWLNKRFSFEEWDESFVKSANGIHNPGYIAALQRIIATRADCLVLVGGGKFQELALRGYLHQHRDRTKWCLHFICPHNGYILNRLVRLAKAGQLN